MSTFKQKPKKNVKKSRKDTGITLDMKHMEMLKFFENEKNNLNNYKKLLTNYKNKLTDLENKDPKQYTNEDIKNKANLKSDIAELENKINSIENEIDEIDYYSQTIDILVDYYNILDDNDQTDDSKTSAKSRPKKQAQIMDFFVKDQPVISKTKNRASLLETYQKITEKKSVTKSDINGPRICVNCNIEKIITVADGAHICPNCGELDELIFENEKPNYKELSQETTTVYPYKRINHFQEILNQVQGRESTQVPNEVYENILIELKKRRITDLAILTPKLMKQILKKLNFNRYYEHIPHIINKLTGLPPPTLTREIEEKFRQMFKMIQEPFSIYCPKEGPNKRKNFLNYSYVLYKFCELLELDHLLVCFPLLKNKEKLQDQDRIWKKICNHLDWEYHSSCN